MRCLPSLVILIPVSSSWTFHRHPSCTSPFSSHTFSTTGRPTSKHSLKLPESLGRTRPRLWERAESTVVAAVSDESTEESTALDDTTTSPLSDLDARVLQSILRDEKVDLRTEEDIRKLLERGTVKTATTSRGPGVEGEDDDDSEFSSTVIKTLTDTKLWKKVSAQASDWFETLSIWVANKVEQDVKVLAALGLFAWERAVRDVARALPEAGQTSRKVMLLSNSSSYQEPTSVRSVLEDMNKPSEEIRQVTRSILEILSGGERSDLDRGLRTAAPAGTVNSGERIRRAYKQRKILDRQSRDVTRIPGKVVDTAFELKRELAAETSRPGYKTASIRNAIGAGVTETGRLLREVKEGARLAAAKKKTLRLQQAKETAKSLRDDIVKDLREERTAIARRLRSCISEPENTWLREEVVLASESRIKFDQNALRDVVMTMMLVRDEIEGNESDESYNELMRDMKSIRKSLEDIRGRAAAATSFGVAEALWESVIGSVVGSDVSPLLLRLDEIDTIMDDTNDIDSIQPSNSVSSDDAVSTTTFFADVESKKKQLASGRGMTSSVFDFVDVTPEAVHRTNLDDGDQNLVEGMDFLDSGVAVEVISDSDFDVAVGNPRRVNEVDENLTEEEQNALMMYSLRFLDVIFFVLEKTFTVAIPKSILLAETFSRRLMEVNQGGKGTNGWQSIRNVADPKGRY